MPTANQGQGKLIWGIEITRVPGSASETGIYLRSPPDSVPRVRGAVLLLGDEELADLPSKAHREGCCLQIGWLGCGIL